MPPLRPILLAKDSPNYVELTLTALHALNLANEIVVVHDGAEVLDFLHHRNAFAGRPAVLPAVIMLDLKMPRVDGLETLRQIRADPDAADASRRHPHVIAGRKRSREKLPARGESDVVKPVDFDQFISAVSQLGVFWAVVNEPPPAAPATS